MTRRVLFLFPLFLLTSWIMAGCGANRAAGESSTTTAIASGETSPWGYTTTAIAAGEKYICLLTDHGAVKCWAKNYRGQLGDGATVENRRFVDVIGLSSGVTAISACENHTCAVMQSGTVKCWGLNYVGQLGDGSTEDRSQPVDVIGLEGGAVAVSIGASHSCALIKDGGVKFWGDNSWGQLGNGTTENSLVPVDVTGLSHSTAEIFADGNQTCIINIIHEVECWGTYIFGRKGDVPIIQNNRPVKIPNLNRGVKAIALGRDHTCALTDGWGIQCWGWNDWGQLGNPFFGSMTTPVLAIRILGKFTSISASWDHTCALRSSGGIICWGYLPGVFGGEDLPNGGFRWTGEPMELDTSALNGKAVSLAAGICALMDDGLIKCWGRSFSGWDEPEGLRIVEIPQ